MRFWLLILLFVSACQTPGPPLKIPQGGMDFEVDQRSQYIVPGTLGGLGVELEDITDGQVVVRLKRDSEILASKSMIESDVLPFEIDGYSYSIKLLNLNNQLIGRDNAILTIIEGEPPPDETAEIKALLDHIRGLDAAYVFIRNGEEHTPEETAAHLERKWKSKSGIRSVDDFIDQLATHSSQSGKPYLVRISNAEATPLAQWLRAEISNSQ